MYCAVCKWEIVSFMSCIITVTTLVCSLKAWTKVRAKSKPRQDLDLMCEVTFVFLIFLISVKDYIKPPQAVRYICATPTGLPVAATRSRCHTPLVGPAIAGIYRS